MKPAGRGLARPRRALALGLLGLATWTTPGSAEPPTLRAPAAQSAGERVLAAEPSSLLKTLHREKVALVSEAPEGGGSWVRGYVVFEQPRSRVMRLLAQTARQREYRPELLRLQSIRSGPDGSVDEHRIKILFVKVVYRLRQRIDFEAHRIEWELDPEFDTPLRAIEGSWELYELGEARTLGCFATRVDVGPALPGFIQDYATRKNVPRTLERTRRWVDSDGTWRP